MFNCTDRHVHFNLRLGNILFCFTDGQHRRVTAIAARHAISGEVAKIGQRRCRRQLPPVSQRNDLSPLSIIFIVIYLIT